MSASETAEAHLDLVGGRLCLDFINTADSHASDHPEEHLTSYAELVAWSQRTNILSEEEGQLLLAEAAQRPIDALAILQEAGVFREVLFRIFLAALAGKTPGTDDLVIFNNTRAQALSRSEIAPTASGFAWHWKVSKQTLGWMLWPVALSAAELLLSPDLKQVRECSSPDCGWLFLDTSKNHTRRWCTMESCGNRDKARRHYQRKRQSVQTQARKPQVSDYS
ncbi:MAG TPA: CGNR zinc finger domain-containing protein [Ktedonobacterales bacterium]|jgi:predicted RNA-binding Zn ribbon-like protein